MGILRLTSPSITPAREEILIVVSAMLESHQTSRRVGEQRSPLNKGGTMGQCQSVHTAIESIANVRVFI